MQRTLIAAVVAAGLFCLMQSPAQAQHISRDNPYRAFNTTGVNYGAQQLQEEYYETYRRLGYVGPYGYPTYAYPTYANTGLGTVTYRSGYSGWNAAPMYAQPVYRGSWSARPAYTARCW